MKSLENKKLDAIIRDIGLIKKELGIATEQQIKESEEKLNIVADRQIKVDDIEDDLVNYEVFAAEDLGIEPITIKNHVSRIRNCLKHSNGILNQKTVQEFLGSNDSTSWKTNHLNALTRYLRDFHKAGKWISEFKVSKQKGKRKGDVPTNEKLSEFFLALDDFQTRLVFLVLFNTGFREHEVLALTYADYNQETRMLDARNIHSGKTKSSWLSFITLQTQELLDYWIQNIQNLQEDTLLFSISPRTLQQRFKDVSQELGINIYPHLFRTIFTDRCRQAGLDKEYMQAFEGRISKGIQESTYTPYGPDVMKREYTKVEEFLQLGFDFNISND